MRPHRPRPAFRTSGTAGTTDPKGLGFWYDRRGRSWWRIEDHLKDACAWPDRVRLHAAEVARILAVPGGFEAQRAVGIPLVAAQGFIRVRLIRDRLGWQFHGDPVGSLRILRRFIRRHDLGPLVLIRWTDFATGLDVEDHLPGLRARLAGIGGAP
jgi:hypothetical protein